MKALFLSLALVLASHWISAGADTSAADKEALQHRLESQVLPFKMKAWTVETVLSPNPDLARAFGTGLDSAAKHGFPENKVPKQVQDEAIRQIAEGQTFIRNFTCRYKDKTDWAILSADKDYLHEDSWSTLSKEIVGEFESSPYRVTFVSNGDDTLAKVLKASLEIQALSLLSKSFSISQDGQNAGLIHLQDSEGHMIARLLFSPEKKLLSTQVFADGKLMEERSLSGEMMICKNFVNGTLQSLQTWTGKEPDLSEEAFAKKVQLPESKFKAEIKLRNSTPLSLTWEEYRDSNSERVAEIKRALAGSRAVH